MRAAPPWLLASRGAVPGAHAARRAAGRRVAAIGLCTALPAARARTFSAALLKSATAPAVAWRAGRRARARARQQVVRRRNNG